MNAQGHTIVLVTHDMRLVAGHARRTVVLHQGRLLADGDTPAVFQRDEVLARAHIEPPQIAQLARRLMPRETPAGALTVEAFYAAYQAL
jgi:energy-coupling factor transport system ATP-binding protein